MMFFFLKEYTYIHILSFIDGANYRLLKKKEKTIEINKIQLNVIEER